MKKQNIIIDSDIADYMRDREHSANMYVMRCYAITILIYSIAFILDLLGIFVVDINIMANGFFPSLAIYAATYFIAKKMSFSNPKTKYLVFFCMVATFTIIGIFVTYHVVLIIVLPTLCATIYASKRFIWYSFVLMFVSNFLVVYGGYYWGLCDANMVLLTTGTIAAHSANGQFLLTTVNENPTLTLFLYFVLPRCLISFAFVAICTNIFSILNGTLERARLASELEKAKEEAESANRAKSQFLARMSHEIRTPINAVLGMNEMIIRESNEPNIKQYAFDVKDSSVMLMGIINDILDSSKIESGMMEIVPVNYSTGSFLNDLYNMINIKACEKGLELIFDIPSDVPSELFGDDKRISQILINLLTNAVKYTEKGRVTLSLGCEIKDENVVLNYSVADTGIGIKKEDISKIYDEFHRVDVSRNRNVEGSGLGMAIVQRLLKLMHSELHVESEYEKGSTFSFSIVQKIVNNKPLGDFRKKTKKASEEKKSWTSFTAPDAKILVVDDFAMNLKVFRSLLKETKMQITDAESGQQCIDLARKQKFDIIFLDHMMPGMDGLEALKIMKEEKLCENIPVIMFTANAIIGDRENYIQSGFNDVLSKPIVPDKLEEMLLTYLPPELIVKSE